MPDVRKIDIAKPMRHAGAGLRSRGITARLFRAAQNIATICVKIERHSEIRVIIKV
jgi:hypothetical protein